MVRLTAGYFQSDYENYERITQQEPRISDNFTRTNRVIGLGCELNF